MSEVTREFDIVIVGGGCVGSSIFSELARHGWHSTALIDNGRNSLSATAQSGGMLRVFHESPDHVELALNHHLLLNTYQKEKWLTAGHYEPNGCLYFFNRRRYKSYVRNLQKMEDANYPFEVINVSQGQERFPQFHWTHQDLAIYEPLAGQLSPKRLTDNLIKNGLRHGFTVFDEFEVQRICYDRGRYRLSGNQSPVTAKTLILAGGARLLPRLFDLGLNFPLEAKELTVFLAEKNYETLNPPNYFDRESMEFAGFGDKRVTLSQKKPLRPVEKFWKENFNQLAAHDCYAPNRQGVLGEVSGYPGLVLATGWGGTAFKFSLTIGRRVAEIVMRSSVDRRMSYASL